MRRADVEKRIENSEGWKVVGSTIEKNYKFSNFMQAIEFINRVADAAEAENHHPDILLWGWNNVKLILTTHAAKGLSEKDFALASKINQIKLK